MPIELHIRKSVLEALVHSAVQQQLYTACVLLSARPSSTTSTSRASRSASSAPLSTSASASTSSSSTSPPSSPRRRHRRPSRSPHPHQPPHAAVDRAPTPAHRDHSHSAMHRRPRALAAVRPLGRLHPRRHQRRWSHRQSRLGSSFHGGGHPHPDHLRVFNLDPFVVFGFDVTSVTTPGSRTSRGGVSSSTASPSVTRPQP